MSDQVGLSGPASYLIVDGLTRGLDTDMKARIEAFKAEKQAAKKSFVEVDPDKIDTTAG